MEPPEKTKHASSWPPLRAEESSSTWPPPHQAESHLQEPPLHNSLPLGCEIVFSDPILQVITFEDLTLAAWCDSPEAEHMRFLLRLDAKVRRRYKEFGFVNLIYGGGIPRFSPEVRALVEELTKLDSPDSPVAHIILIGGLVGATVRAFLNTSLLVSRPVSPTRFFSEEALAAQWIASRMPTPGRWDQARVQQGFDAMRQTYGPASSNA